MKKFTRADLGKIQTGFYFTRVKGSNWTIVRVISYGGAITDIIDSADGSRYGLADFRAPFVGPIDPSEDVLTALGGNIR